MINVETKTVKPSDVTVGDQIVVRDNGGSTHTVTELGNPSSVWSEGVVVVTVGEDNPTPMILTGDVEIVK